MPALIDLAGQHFGLLRVITRLPDKTAPSGARQPLWGCVCRCGRRTVEEGRALRAGRALSCRTCVRDPSRMLKYGRVYLVYFPKHQVLKIGFHTSTRRIQELINAGGIRIDEYRDVDKSWEDVGRTALDELFPPAFTSRDDARHILPRGAGWTDCFAVDPTDLDIAKHAVMWAGIKKGNDFGDNPPATPTWRRALTSIQRARRSARLRCADAARVEGAARVAEPDSAGRGMDLHSAVPGAADSMGGRPSHPRRACTGGRGTRTHVGAQRPRMAHPAPIPALSRVCAPSTRARPAARGLSAPIFIGLGERERKKERTRSRGRAKACAGAGGGGRSGVGGAVAGRVRLEGSAGTSRTSSPPHGAPVGLPRSPERDGRDGVRPLRHGGRAAPHVPGPTQVRRAAGSVRGAAVGGPRK